MWPVTFTHNNLEIIENIKMYVLIVAGEEVDGNQLLKTPDSVTTGHSNLFLYHVSSFIEVDEIIKIKWFRSWDGIPSQED